MNAREFLVTTVHEIPISTELAITARTSEEAGTHTLANRPALHTGAKSIDPPDRFMPGDARPIDRKHTFHGSGIGMANPARLDANAHLTGSRIDQRFHYGCKFSRFRYLDCFIHCAHSASLKALTPTVGIFMSSVRPGPEFCLAASVPLTVISSSGCATSEPC